MSGLSYSVVIRTLGNSGEKYKVLLDSILAQTVKPEEILAVLPHGHELDYKCGCETIVYSEKGMVSQRAVGIMRCKSDYMLVVDDDLAFGPRLVEELYDYLSKNNLDCCFPMEGGVEDTPGSSLIYHYPFPSILRNGFTGQFFISRRKSKFLDKITYTAGHKVFVNCNNKDECYFLQTGNFQVFFIRSICAKNNHFEDEIWLQNGTITQYASYDDPTFFYKLYLSGAVLGYSLRTRYRHLDATSGRKTNSLLESKRIRYYSVAKNRTIFWYKFIWLPNKTSIKVFPALFGGLYGSINYMIWNIIICLYPKYWPAIKAMFAGYSDAIAFIRENKTTTCPKVV